MNRKFWEDQRDLVTDRSQLFGNSKSATKSMNNNNLNSKGDFYYLGKNIEEIKGDSVIDVLREIPMFAQSFSEFQTPTINTSYNIILLEGETSYRQGQTSDMFENYQVEDLFDKYKNRDEVYPKIGLTTNLYESDEFQKTISEHRGLIVITINDKYYKKNPKEWYKVKDQSEVVAHEFIIHAMRRIKGEPRNENADHDYYFTDTKLGVYYDGSFSPNEQYLLQEAPNAPWAEFYRQLNKVIDKKYPKNNRIKYNKND